GDEELQGNRGLAGAGTAFQKMQAVGRPATPKHPGEAGHARARPWQQVRPDVPPQSPSVPPNPVRSARTGATSTPPPRKPTGVPFADRVGGWGRARAPAGLRHAKPPRP